MKRNRLSFASSLAALVLSVGAAGCGGDDSSGAPSVDGGSAKDGQVSQDGGGTQDSGNRDAGLTDGSTVGDAADGATGTSFVASLSGAEETPAVATTATGAGTFTLSADKKTLTYHVTHNVAGATAAHIHLGDGGEAGAVVFPLTPFSADMTGTITLATADAANLEQGKFYVNVHSPTHTGGEIRGQMLHPGDKLYVATLTGAQETPPVTSAGTGTSAVIVDAAGANIRYHVKVTGITPTAAHIHNGLGGIAGPVVHPLTPVATTIDGTVAALATDAADLADGHFYVNVHTTLNAGGEIRGQLMVAGETLYTAIMSPANEVPPVVGSTAEGGAQFILNYAKSSIRYEAAFKNLVATAAHIHTGAVGINGNVLYPLTLDAAKKGAKGTQAVVAADVTALDASGLYANAHSTVNTGGEIRGQITKQ